MQTPHRYLIYPSLLDKYQSLLDYGVEAEQPWNKTPDGDYVLTPDQMYDKIEQELIDTINRVEREVSEAADRGTSLNEVIDCMVLGRRCEREDMTIASNRIDGVPISIRVDYNGFTFEFEPQLCYELREMLRGSVCQMKVEAPIQTKYGSVLLYGYLDYWLRDKVIDLKTTSKYNFGKYERKWQRYVYPYCCVRSGLASEVTEFTYLAVELHGKTIIGGRIYPETYTLNPAQDKRALCNHVESFIRWLNTPSVAERITDTKIFNYNRDLWQIS